MQIGKLSNGRTSTTNQQSPNSNVSYNDLERVEKMFFFFCVVLFEKYITNQ